MRGTECSDLRASVIAHLNQRLFSLQPRILRGLNGLQQSLVASSDAVTDGSWPSLRLKKLVERPLDEQKKEVIKYFNYYQSDCEKDNTDLLPIQTQMTIMVGITGRFW